MKPAPSNKMITASERNKDNGEESDNAVPVQTIRRAVADKHNRRRKDCKAD